MTGDSGGGLYQARLEDGDVIIVLGKEYKALASTVDGGYRSRVKQVLFHHVEQCPIDCDPHDYAENAARRHGLDPEETIVFMTGASLPEKLYIEEWRDPQQALIASVGLTPVACAHGVEGQRAGTINIAYITDARLTPHAMVEAVSLISAAKAVSATHHHLGCGPGKGPSYGTGTDAVAILSNPEGETQEYIGPLTRQGSRLFSKVQALLSRAITGALTLEERFRHTTGVSLPELVEAGLAYYDKAPVPGVEGEKIRRLLEETLLRVLRDPNTWALLAAARHLDDAGGLGGLPGLTVSEYASDSKGIVADELLGITLAMYINGWRGLFAYYWVDRTKHESGTVLGRLPMFMDDLLGALLGGVLSRVYDELLGGAG